MSDINRICLTGRIGKDPEFKYLESGTIITKFTLAVNRYDTKEKKEVADWFNVTTFSKMGEYLKKGYKVAIDGRLQTNTWTNDKGENQKAVFVLADSIENLTPKEKTEVKNDTDEIPF